MVRSVSKCAGLNGHEPWVLALHANGRTAAV
jgi:hypothetical protein